jgi:hypothetical protein
MGQPLGDVCPTGIGKKANNAACDTVCIRREFSGTTREQLNGIDVEINIASCELFHGTAASKIA